MGTEVAISFSSLRAQLENEKTSLFKIDENIKKIQVSGRSFSNDSRFNNTSGDYYKSGFRAGGRNSFQDTGNNYKNEDQFGKRKHETKTVFSRLSARVQDSDGEDDGPGIKRARVPSAVCRELPTRAAVLRAQGDDEQARKRNRRIFGSLLGTLQKFKQEEIVLQTKEDKKAQVERKIEEQARQEKEREQKERKTLYAEREHKKTKIKNLEAKMARVQEFERWEESQKSLGNFILTKAKPHVYWLPKKMTEKAAEKLNSSRKFHEKCMTKKRQELQEQLLRIEQRCPRPRGPGTKENDPELTEKDVEMPLQKDSTTDQDEEMKEDEKGHRRNKFAMDADENEKEDSDGDDRHEAPSDETVPTNEKESDVSKLDTSEDQHMSVDVNTTTEETDAKESNLTNGAQPLQPSSLVAVTSELNEESINEQATEEKPDENSEHS